MLLVEAAGARTRRSAAGSDRPRRGSTKIGAGGPCARLNTASKLLGAFRLLDGEHRQVLGHRVAEDRAEHAGVVAAAVAGANHRLLVDLVGGAEPGRPVDLVLDVAGQVDVAHAAHPDLAGVDVQPAAVARLVDRLRVVDVGAQAVVEGQLRGGAPGVLDVVEVPPLALPRVRARADEALEEGHVAQEEGGEAEPAAVRAARPVVAEAELARPVGVARDAQVVGAADVDAELHGVVAEHLREVRDDLPLLLVLGQRAVAAIDLEARSKLDVTRSAGVVASQEYRRQPGGEGVVEVQAGDPGVGRAASCRSRTAARPPCTGTSRSGSRGWSSS